MTARQMMALLNHRALALPKADDINDAMRLTFLNLAVEWAVPLLERHYLHELETSALAQALDSTAGYFDLSTLTTPVFMPERGLYGVKLTGGKFATKKSFEEYRILTNKLALTTSAYDPIYTIIGSRIYVQPFTGQTVDLYYLKQPDEILFDVMPTFTMTGGTSSTTFTCTSALLSTTNDAYNGYTIHSITQNSDHVVTAFIGVTQQFVVTPGAAQSFAEGQTFRFLDTGVTSNVPTDTSCNLSSLVHPIIVEYAASMLYQSCGEFKLAAASREEAQNMLYQMNHMEPPTDSVRMNHEMASDDINGDNFPLILDFSDLS